MLFREVTTGWAKRIRLENSLALQVATIVRPQQMKLSAAITIHAINGQLAEDAKLKKVFDGITLVLPTDA